MLDFDETLTKAETMEEVKKLKVWMFQEQVKIQAKRDELNELSHELTEERRLLEKERNALKRKIEAENKRFQDNELLVAKKLKIIENAFQQISVDRKVLECERLNLEYEKRNFMQQKANAKVVREQMHSYEDVMFFQGIDNELALRKRYKELLKIYHPDNRCGDTNTLLRIQTEYDHMKKQYYEI